jgi:hypothetical protein
MAVRIIPCAFIYLEVVACLLVWPEAIINYKKCDCIYYFLKCPAMPRKNPTTLFHMDTTTPTVPAKIN